MAKRFLLTALAALSLVPLAAFLALQSGNPTLEAGGDLSAALEECRGGIATLAAASSEASRECMTEVSRAALREGRMVELQAAFDGEIERIPGMQNLCHDIGHYVGREAYQPGSSITEVMKDARESCIFGFGHGIMDGIAASGPSDSVLQETALACAELEGVGSGLCIDGLGHLAWSSTGNIEDAVQVCAYLPEWTYRTQCAEGIIMQIYAPAGFLPSADIRESPGELEELCEDWPGPWDIRQGCYTGAGYAYMQGVSTAFFLWRTNPEVHDSATTRDILKEETALAAELCRRHANTEGILLCEKSIYYQIPAAVEEVEQGLKSTLCDYLDVSLRDDCMEYWPYFG